MRDIQDYTNKYDDEPFETTMVGIRKKMVIAQCNKYIHDNILEIGCGMNPFFLDFHDYRRMVIAEPGKKFADNARKLSHLEEKEISVVEGFLEERTETVKSIFERNNIDFIILSSVLHELDNPEKMLAAISDLCSNNTVVHINVPNANSIHRLIAIEAGMIKDVHEQSAQMQKMQRRRTYDIELLRKDVEQAGFEIIDSGSYFIKPFTHLQMQMCKDYGIIDDKVLEGLEKLVKYIPEYGAGIYVNMRRKGKN